VLDLQRELAHARDQLQYASSVQDQLAQAQEDLRRAQGREAELRREVQAAKDAAQLQHTVRMAGLQSELAAAQQETRARDQELRSKDQELNAKEQVRTGRAPFILAVFPSAATFLMHIQLPAQTRIRHTL